MRWGGWAVVAAIIFSSGQGFAESSYRVEIDLQEQRAYLLRNGRAVLASPISTGRAGHLTETGSFRIIEKERNHYSSLYGKIVDASGRTIVSDADADMRVPRGDKFIPAPMACTRVICLGIPLRTAAFECRKKWRLRSLMSLTSVRPSTSSGERREPANICGMARSLCDFRLSSAHLNEIPGTTIRDMIHDSIRGGARL